MLHLEMTDYHKTLKISHFYKTLNCRCAKPARTAGTDLNAGPAAGDMQISILK